ncbi:MAG: amidohydrolase family protein [Anaerolineales bacterium]
MTLTHTVSSAASASRPQSDAIIDCDIHNYVATKAQLAPYLSKRWRQHHERYGFDLYYPGGYYPRVSPAASRADAWPPSGHRPGSDLDFMRLQLLDEWNVAYGILNPLHFPGDQPNLEYGQALATALNNWQIVDWLDPEPRLRAAMVVQYEDGEMAAAEIEHRVSERRFVHVLLPVRTSEPLGRRKYWKLYAAAEQCGFPIGIHFGGAGGWPITGAGQASYYLEDHGGMSQSFQAQVISLVLEGVFERFPKLKVVLIEGGFAWLPPLMWRLDSAWKRLREEVPHLTRLPSDVVREHFYFTTQPIEEPHRPEHFGQLLDMLAMDDHILFASDYPHWDFDSPEHALPNSVSRALRGKIMSSNAQALYHFV